MYEMKIHFKNALETIQVSSYLCEVFSAFNIKQSQFMSL